MGKIVAVLGLGDSLRLYDNNDYDLTIGVNDIWKWVESEVVVCVDHQKAFTPERLKTIRNCKPKAFYSQIVEWDYRTDFKKINILSGYPDLACPIRKEGYWKSFCSPFIAVQIAFKEYNATEIHLFGVDLLNHPHLDMNLCQKIKKHFKLLKHSLEERGCKFIVHGEGILTALS